VDSVQILILMAAVGSIAIACRAGHLVGAGVLCILVTFIVLLQPVAIPITRGSLGLGPMP